MFSFGHPGVPDLILHLPPGKGKPIIVDGREVKDDRSVMALVWQRTVNVL